MKIKSKVLQYFHLDPAHSLLDAKSVRILKEWFDLLDIHKKSGLNDVQFVAFTKHATDLSKPQIYKLFDMLDVDGSGEIEFDEFYLLITLLIAIKDGEEKNYIFRHARQIFDLIDEDGSGEVSADEFEAFAFLFNFRKAAAKKLFQEFDVSGDQLLDFDEFQMFAIAAIEEEAGERELRGGLWDPNRWPWIFRPIVRFVTEGTTIGGCDRTVDDVEQVEEERKFCQPHAFKNRVFPEDQDGTDHEEDGSLADGIPLYSQSSRRKKRDTVAKTRV